MVDFAGWSVPISYEGIGAEHRAVRDDLGIFDVSHLGTLEVVGPAAAAAIAQAFTNDGAGLRVGRAQYTLCCDEQGGVLDDLIVYRVADGHYLAVPNAANTGRVRRRLEAVAGADPDTEVVDRSTEQAVLAVQGPRSLEAVTEATAVQAAQLDYLGVTGASLGGADGWVARTGYTGELGCELILPGGAAESVWRALVDGAGARPVGLGARDTLRLEMGYPLHGNELSPETTPYEARLGWAVALDRGEFVGRDALAAMAGREPERRLWGVESAGRRPPRTGMEVLDDGRPAGRVTSGTTSPTRRVGIGLAYLRSPIGPGDEVTVDLRGSPHPFTVVRPPFVECDPRGGP